MDAVILAAGKGTRLGELTLKIPKSLTLISGKTIIEYTLNSLPSRITRAIIVIGHLGEKIKNHLGASYGLINIDYVEQKNMSGTAGAFWEARNILSSGKTLVLNGDDIYDQKELEAITNYDLAMGLSHGPPLNDKFFAIEIGDDGFIKNCRRPNAEEKVEGIFMANGAYVVDERLFSYEPIALPTGEHGLPQTIFKMAKDYPVKAVIMKHWLPINTPADIKKAEAELSGGVA